MAARVPCSLCGGSRLPLKMAAFRTLWNTTWACVHCDTACTKTGCDSCRRVDSNLRGL